MRTKRDFPTGKLRLIYPVSSFDANKKYALNFEYSFDGAIIRKDTGYRVRVKDWNKDGNEKKGALRSSYGADYIHDNSKLITALFKYDSEMMAFYENDKEARRREYVEMFLFAFHAGGMRLVDVMTLQWAHVDFDRKEIRKVLVKTLTFHCARHSFAINALNDEEHPLDMYQVSRLLGHASTETTEKVYADYITSTLREKMTDLGFDFLPELGG